MLKQCFVLGMNKIMLTQNVADVPYSFCFKIISVMSSDVGIIKNDQLIFILAFPGSRPICENGGRIPATLLLSPRVFIKDCVS